MKNKLFKTALFGYSKTDVCNYIAKTNQEFNDKLEQLISAHQKEREELMAQKNALQEELNNFQDAVMQIQNIISPFTNQ
ncbi:MAG: hypothetical protein IJA54_04680 [Tyzzerella sp.]|nr:hypothetical protein [Tyzzerella sp.]